MFERIKAIFGLETKNATATLKDYEQLAAIFGITQTISGAAVTPATAMRCQPFGSGARLIAESIASLPVHVYDKNSDGSKERDADNVIHELLDDTPSEIESAFSFKSEMQLDCILHNDAYAYINRVNGEIRELVRLPSLAVTVDVNPITMVPVYTYARANRDRPMECDRHHQPPDRGWADHRKVRARARQHGAGCQRDRTPDHFRKDAAWRSPSAAVEFQQRDVGSARRGRQHEIQQSAFRRQN